LCAGEAYEERTWWRERTADEFASRLNLCGCREGARGTRRNGERADQRAKRRGRVGTPRERTRKIEGERERERDTRKCEKEANDATVRGPYDRRNNSRRSDEDEQRRSRRAARKSEMAGREGWPITCVGEQRDATRGPKPAAHARQAWERALMPRRSLVLSLALLSLLFSSRSIHESPVRWAWLYPSSTALPLSFSLSLSKGSAFSLSIAVGTHRRASPITAECARSKAPRAHVVIRSGVLSIWVIANANKDNTWHTIMSRNYAAYRI